MTIGEKVKQAREAKGMTQEELAHALGYKSRTSVNKIETGERDVPHKQIKKIAQILGIPPISLLGLEDEFLPQNVAPFKLKTNTKEGQKKAKEALEKGFAQLASPQKEPVPAETVQDRLKKEAENMTTAELVECLGIVQKELEKKSQGSGA